MKFINPIPFVRDVAVSKAFYRDVLGLAVREDHGAFVLFEGGFAIHGAAELTDTVWKGDRRVADGPLGRDNLLLYFEEGDIDAAFARIAGRVALIHAVERQAWGQRVFRFYDPDGHVIDVGEPMAGGAG
ncbi:MAG: VOC family protein [Inquilinaceae bacterium]